ncbi:SinI family restriction endonuclease [Meiothermus sp.]|uniref:SinI family restriction endonuclease n=1 Tax=Meiothermus sp. TaxID=1955249 RepID=UPI0021DC55D6|nr:SinI family restriction endonuclease [Meiothermus sp.]GIW33655.1 MAG: hypothetical protein KatS3mg072_0988 [Meiothermus sp.]
MNFEDLLTSAKSTVRILGKPWDKRLEVILSYCWQSPKQGAFPKIGRLSLLENTSAYLERYIERYFQAQEQKLYLREVKTSADPALGVILGAFAKVENLPKATEHHRISMAAENLLGELLERYIAERLEPYGWVWCAGNTVRSVDFLRQDLSIALQIKNRDNSENSSSSAIRAGTNIQKWFRIYSKTGKTNWENFPFGEGLSEEDFHRYIQNYAKSLK